MKRTILVHTDWDIVDDKMLINRKYTLKLIGKMLHTLQENEKRKFTDVHHFISTIWEKGVSVTEFEVDASILKRLYNLNLIGIHFSWATLNTVSENSTYKRIVNIVTEDIYNAEERAKTFREEEERFKNLATVQEKEIETLNAILTQLKQEE